MKVEMKSVFAGVLLGLVLVFLLGAVVQVQEHQVHMDGEVKSSTVLYQSTFSGITPEGDCYLAITDTQTGITEIVKVTGSLDKHFHDTAFLKAKEGRMTTEPTAR